MSWKTALSLLGTAAVLSLVCPIQATAGSPGDLTQGEYLQWLAKASARKASLPVNATAADYVKWAVARGIMPAGGWQPEAPLTRDVYAQTLAQLYGVSATTDPVRALRSEGVIVPATKLITRATVLQELGDIGFRSGTALESRHPATPIDHDPKEVICHKGLILVIPHSAYGGHAGHGDHLGVCQDRDRDRYDKYDKNDKKGGDH